jgi:hypothetical protein
MSVSTLRSKSLSMWACSAHCLTKFWRRHLVFDHKLSNGNWLRKRRQNLTGIGRRKEIDGAAGIQQQTVAAGDAFRRWRDLPRR